jgi:hypothetical protein
LTQDQIELAPFQLGDGRVRADNADEGPFDLGFSQVVLIEAGELNILVCGILDELVRSAADGRIGRKRAIDHLFDRDVSEDVIGNDMQFGEAVQHGGKYALCLYLEGLLIDDLESGQVLGLPFFPGLGPGNAGDEIKIHEGVIGV